MLNSSCGTSRIGPDLDTGRLAWHASGTFDKNDGSGGSNGAGMRFEPESSEIWTIRIMKMKEFGAQFLLLFLLAWQTSADDANAGLGIMRDILKPVKDRHPELSYADLWTFAGAAAVEV